MSEIKQPTAGRIVQFFHNGEEAYNLASNNRAEFVPALVTQAFEDVHNANMTIFPVGLPPIFGWSIPHLSSKAEGRAYWAYPEIK